MENRFISDNPENADFNQYWFSPKTIETLVLEVVDACPDVKHAAAFLSTPSVYFSLPDALRARSKLFDLDEKWTDVPGFIKYDYSSPSQFPEGLRGSFEVVVIDPPFITEAVWTLYAETAKLLLRPGGKIIGSTIAENAPVLLRLLDLKPELFMPSIPNLVYQYNFYTNFETTHLKNMNAELPSFDE